MDSEPTKLKRSLGLPMITFYGVGTIVGGGFYALVGKVAAEAGLLTPVAFFAASAIALFSALSFAELGSRFPVSAGESQYVLEAFRRNWLSAVVGWMVIITGIVSAATLANAFAGFFQTFVTVSDQLLIVVLVVSLGLVASWGIGESAMLALIITVIEVGGLIFIFVSGAHNLSTIPERWSELIPNASIQSWSSIFLGAYLAFYSFVGFEDMVNVAEEVKRPERNLPIAILVSLMVTTVLYVLVTLIAVLSVPQAELIQSKAPLSLVVASESGRAAAVMTTIAMFAGVNGALVQIVMASRVAYGMASRGLAPRLFSDVHPKTRTPIKATLAMTIGVLILALWFPLLTLAKATSTILLLVYALVNLSLWRIKWVDRSQRVQGPNYPMWISVTGFFLCVGFVLFHAISVFA